jgi:hypothetical protein
MKSVNYSLKRISGLFLVLAITLGFANNLMAGDLKTIQEKTLPTSLGKKLELSTSSGDVYISTWDRPEVYVRISGNRKAYDKMHFNIQETGDGVKVSGRNESWFSFGWNVLYVKYEVKLPASYNAAIKTSGGDIKIYDLDGTIKFETSGGDITLINTKGYTNLSTSGGDIKLENTRGDVKMSAAKRAILDAHAAAKYMDDDEYCNLYHAIGHAGATVHVETHALGLVFYELTAIVLKYGKDGYEKPVREKIEYYYNRLLYWQEHTDKLSYKWAGFLTDDTRPNKERLLSEKRNLKHQ